VAVDPTADGVSELVTEALAAVEAAPVPPLLRDRVLGAALASRPPGRPLGVEPLAPVESYRRTIGELDEVLAGLDARDWSAPVHRYGWSVQGLVGHLVAVEQLLGARLGVDVLPADPDGDHIAMSLDAVAAQEGRDPATTLHDWRAVTRRALDALAADPPDPEARVPFHGVDHRWGSLLVARTLEVWTHTDDIRVAVGLAPVAPDEARLALMTDLAVRTLPLRLATTGATFTGTARIVLTGRGGGAWTQPLAPGEPGGPAGGVPGAPVVRLVADAIAFCRLSAGRIGPADLAATVTGDAGLADAILGSAAVFAV
jgi:uncharacterized protein (TIGR03083 family)